tara:strand:- start:17 stop:295 length:279 start_codon:yes stop_codon:yes gene_type:complete
MLNPITNKVINKAYAQKYTKITMINTNEEVELAYNTSLISKNNTRSNNNLITNMKKTHEEGNCICFILTLIFYLIGSKGKKYTVENNTTNIL